MGSKRFVKPSIKDVQAYIEARGYNLVNPEEFWHYYESNGWHVGRKPMKSWKSAVAYWQTRRKQQRGGRVRIASDPDFEGRF